MSRNIVSIGLLLATVPLLPLLDTCWCHNNIDNATQGHLHPHTNHITSGTHYWRSNVSRAARRRHVSVASVVNLESQSGLKCGRSLSTMSDYWSVRLRIVGGRTASIAEYPWQVSLQREKRYWFGFRAYYHSCAGSLITPSWVLTAAHCIDGRDEPLRIVAGADDLSLLYRSQFRSARRQIIHNDYDRETTDNDIALIKVSRPFEMTSTMSHIGTVCLDKHVPIIPYDIVTVSGWGSPSFGIKSDHRLHSVDVAIVDYKTCNRSFEYTITDNMFCAGGMIANGRDACTGDSGGPLQRFADGYATLVGVVSFGNECARQGYPGIYTRVSHFYDWIVANIDEPLFPAT